MTIATFVAMVMAVVFAQTAQANSPSIAVMVRDNDIPICKDLSEPIRTFLLGMNRYKKASGQEERDNLLFVECTTTGVIAEWRLMNKKGKPIPVATTPQIRPEPNQTRDSFAYVIVKQVIDALPWDGELFALKKISSKRTKFLNTAAATSYYRSELSTGYATDIKLGRCVPLEVLTFNPKARGAIQVGYGLILNARTASGSVEIAIVQKKAPVDRLYYRLMFGSSIPAWMEPQIAACKTAQGEAKESFIDLSDMLTEFDTSADALIELNSVTQRGGLYFGQMKTNNSLNVKQVIAAYVTNKVDFGNWASADMRAFRTLKTSAYSDAYNIDSKKLKPEGTVAEGYAMLRFSNYRFTLAGGPGLLIDKFNVPFMPEGEEDQVDPETGDVIKRSPSQRRSTLRPSGAVTFRVEWERMWTDWKISRSLSVVSPATSIDADFNYALTGTWFAGGGFYHIRMGDTIFGEPGVRFTGIGAHIGILLKRKRD
jgi:hypothetical protein